MRYLMSIAETLLSSMKVSWHLKYVLYTMSFTHVEDQAELFPEVSDLAECICPLSTEGCVQGGNVARCLWVSLYFQCWIKFGHLVSQAHFIFVSIAHLTHEWNWGIFLRCCSLCCSAEATVLYWVLHFMLCLSAFTKWFPWAISYPYIIFLVSQQHMLYLLEHTH